MLWQHKLWFLLVRVFLWTIGGYSGYYFFRSSVEKFKTWRSRFCFYQVCANCHVFKIIFFFQFSFKIGLCLLSFFLLLFIQKFYRFVNITNENRKPNITVEIAENSRCIQYMSFDLLWLLNMLNSGVVKWKKKCVSLIAFLWLMHFESHIFHEHYSICIQ